MMHLFADPTFWVAISTTLCFGFLIYKAYPVVLSSLDARSAQIRARLMEAENLRLEAEKILREYREKSARASEEAAQILREASLQADAMRARMEEEMRQTLIRQEASAKQRLQRLEQDTIEAVKASVIAAALQRAAENMPDAGSVEAALEEAVTTLVGHTQKTLH